MDKQTIKTPSGLVPSTQHRRTTIEPVEVYFLRVNCKGKGKGLDTCYSAAYMSQTRDQQRFTISEVAADWHELELVLQLIMWPSITRTNGQLNPRCS